MAGTVWGFGKANLAANWTLAAYPVVVSDV
jgi:hypothetical protein